MKVKNRKKSYLRNDIKAMKGSIILRRKKVLTMTSAITLGCLRGLQRNAMSLVKATTKHICTINKGSA